MNKRWGFFVLAVILLAAGYKSRSFGESDKLQVGMVWLSDNQSFQDMRNGFMDEMRSLGYGEDELEFILQDAGGSTETLYSILSSMEDREMDLVVPLVTSAAQAAVNRLEKTPIIFLSVTDPVGAGIMSDRNHPDRNATGTCNEVPIKELFDLALKLTPGIKRIGILYDPALPNSVLTADRAKEYFEQAGLEWSERAITGSNEVQAATQALAQETDAIYVPIDSTVLSAMPQVTEVAGKAGIPVYGSAPSMVEYGALATVSVSEYETGRQTAALADRYFRGEALEDIPAQTIDDFLTVINTDTAKKLSISIPEYILKEAHTVEK